MKIKTLNTVPFVIAYMISLPIEGFILTLLGFKALTIPLLVFSITSTILLFRAFTGTLRIDLQNEAEIIIIQWDKKPLFSKMENQTIKLSDIKNWKFYSGRIADRLKIYFNDNSSLKIDFNNMIDFGENGKNAEKLLFFLDTKNIQQE
jgi:hypothetical protein